MEKIIVPIVGLDSPSLRRAQRVVFILVAVPLLLGAWERAHVAGSLDGFDRFLVVILLAGAGLDLTMAACVDCLTLLRRDLVERLPFFITGILSLVDAADKMRQGSHALHVAYFAVGVLNIVVAVFLNRIRSTRTLTVDSTGVVIQRSRFRRLRLARSDLQDVNAEGRFVRLQLRGGDWVTVELSPDGVVGPNELAARLRDLRVA